MVKWINKDKIVAVNEWRL